MTFFADEGLDAPLVEWLRQKGFTVIYALQLMPGASDEEILQHANSLQAILITKDKDFEELIFRNKKHTHDVLLIRIDKLNEPNNCQKVSDFLKLDNQDLPNSFTVLEEDKIRIRGV